MLLRTIIIDDEEDSVNLLKLQLAEHCPQVKLVGNFTSSVKALQNIEALDPDLLFLDIEMPVMNGYEAASFIRKEMNDNIPIIAMTAHAMAGERERCLSLGMNDYISKPINANLLFEKMYDLTINS